MSLSTILIYNIIYDIFCAKEKNLDHLFECKMMSLIKLLKQILNYFIQFCSFPCINLKKNVRPTENNCPDLFSLIKRNWEIDNFNFNLNISIQITIFNWWMFSPFMLKDGTQFFSPNIIKYPQTTHINYFESRKRDF